MKFVFPLLSIAIVSSSLLAGTTFKETSDYRDTKVLKSYLNVKLDTYAQMTKEPKGTDCDWVMVSPDFNIDDVRKSTVTFYPDSIGRNGGFDASYWALAYGWYGNGLVASFEGAVGTRGIKLQRFKANGANQVPMSPMQMQMQLMYGGQPQQAVPAAPKATEPPALTVMQQKIEMDRYDDDKAKFGLDEAVKRSEEREKKRKTDWQANQSVELVKAAEDAKPKNPEDLPGYVLVVYITESKVNTGTMFIPFMPTTNTTTGEFVLLRDGKPVLAGRHNSVGAYTGSAPKCGTALATAFDVKMVK